MLKRPIFAMDEGYLLRLISEYYSNHNFAPDPIPTKVGLLKYLIKHVEQLATPLVGTEWVPCRKLPVTVHVREQRKEESHVSTREGITPIKPDDLIMRGVEGEEYPIGRDLFTRTYELV